MKWLPPDWLHAWQRASIATLQKKGLKMVYQQFFCQEILAEDFHCDSETDHLLAAATNSTSDKYESAGSTCVMASPTPKTSTCRTHAPLMPEGIYTFHLTWKIRDWLI